MERIVLVSGKAEHGKTLFSNILQEKLEQRGWRILRMAFADYLKFIASKYYGWDGNKDSDGRNLLQYIGTDMVRDKEPNFWVSGVLKTIDVLSGDFDYTILDDCRFKNELYMKSKLPVTSVRATRLGNRNDHYENSLSEAQRKHPSEIDLDNEKFDFYATSLEGIEFVEDAVDRFLKKLHDNETI